MVWIEATAEKNITVRATPEAAFQLLSDVPTIGMMWPGVDRVEPLGDNQYRWELEPRRTLGIVFKAEYVAQYKHNGRDEVTYDTVSGNVRSSGVWRVIPRGSGTEISMRVTSELEAPVPRMLKKPAELFAKKEVSDGLTAQLDQIRRRLESA